VIEREIKIKVWHLKTRDVYVRCWFGKCHEQPRIKNSDKKICDINLVISYEIKYLIK